MPESDRLKQKNTAANDLAGRLNRFLEETQTDGFPSLALDIFRFQFESNPPYRAFAKSLGITPDTISNWEDIPAIPTSAFKLPAHPLTCVSDPKTTFLTSGTTTEVKGAHHFPDTSLYEHSIDQAWPLPNLPAFFLAPSNLENPKSSLSHMFAHLNTGDDSRFLLRNSRFHLSPLLEAIGQGHSVFLMGTALAFLHLMESIGPLTLPDGSHILETGGYKGTSHNLSKTELYQDLSSFFEVTPDHIHNEYGMTELSSQAYATGPNGSHRFPHWCRARILDPETNDPVPPGQTGYLVIHDLANLYSVSAIRTQDFAIRHDDESFTLIGRDPGALPRGCSRTIDHALSS